MPTDGASNLEGSYRVRVFRPAWSDVQHWFPRTRDKIEVRSHALKLRFWPEATPTTDQGTILDVDWCWIKALRAHDIGELRIADTIGGFNNIRIVFFRGDPNVRRPLPIIWILAVMQKKRDEWTAANLKTFRGRQILVRERYYTNRVFE